MCINANSNTRSPMLIRFCLQLSPPSLCRTAPTTHPHAKAPERKYLSDARTGGITSIIPNLGSVSTSAQLTQSNRSQDQLVQHRQYQRTRSLCPSIVARQLSSSPHLVSFSLRNRAVSINCLPPPSSTQNILSPKSTTCPFSSIYSLEAPASTLLPPFPISSPILPPPPHRPSLLPLHNQNV